MDGKTKNVAQLISFPREKSELLIFSMHHEFVVNSIRAILFCHLDVGTASTIVGTKRVFKNLKSMGLQMAKLQKVF